METWDALPELDLQTEITALQWNLLAECKEIVYITKAQVGGLAGLMNEGLPDLGDSQANREIRIRALRFLVGEAVRQITGIEVTSSKNLTSPVASFLIERLKEHAAWIDPYLDLSGEPPWRLSRYGRKLLTLTAEHLEVKVAD